MLEYIDIMKCIHMYLENVPSKIVTAIEILRKILNREKIPEFFIRTYLEKDEIFLFIRMRCMILVCKHQYLYFPTMYAL